MAVMGVWAFPLCTRHRYIKQKDKKPWNNTKEIFPEQKTKKSFVLHHLCPVHEVLTGIWNLFSQGKYTFDCQSGNLKNYASGNHVWTRVLTNCEPASQRASESCESSQWVMRVMRVIMWAMRDRSSKERESIFWRIISNLTFLTFVAWN